MKIGIVSEGQAEVLALRKIIDQLEIPDAQFVNPLYADMQPKAEPAQIARKAVSRLEILLARNVDLVVVIIDREDRSDCPPGFSSSISTCFRVLGYQNVSVVVKNRKFENWLISDPSSLAKKMKSRLSIDQAFVNSIVPNRADNVADAAALINRVCNGKSYHKGKDSIAISTIISPIIMAENSRSFRKFLRAIGHPAFVAQSKRPAT